MAFTARLTPEVEADAKAYADRVGLSLNALLSVALRDYLDARPPMRPSVAPSVAAPMAPAPAQTFKPPASRSDPCPCGAKSPDGYPVKWKHCHGRHSQA